MVELILKYLNKIKHLFVIIPVLVGIMIAAGLFFAHEKSEPEFASKVDKVMFDIKDKSPKYVMTLPKDLPPKQVIDEKDDFVKKQETVKEEVKPKTNNDKLNALNIPFISRLPKAEGNEPLVNPLPEDDLLEKGEKKELLPIKNGIRKPWEVYGRKVDVMPMFNKVAVVIKNVGTNPVNTDAIINRLPAAVSLSFSPYATMLPEQVEKARNNGHETYLDMLLPPRDFINTDAGPFALRFDQPSANNIKMLEEMLSAKMAVGGFVMADGIDDKVYNPQIIAVMDMLEKRGLLLLDATHGVNISANNVQGLDRVKADVVIDNDFNRSSIKDKLQQAEQHALHNGSVVVVLDPKPVAVLAVYDWFKTFSKQLTYEEMKAQEVTSFEKPLTLVPLSNLAGEY